MGLTKALIGIFGGAICGGLLLLGPLESVLAQSAPAAVASRGVLIEQPHCASADNTDAVSAQPAPVVASSAAGDSIAVAVPNTAMLQLDDSGRISAALTNTGCAPRPGDETYVEQADGSLQRVASFDFGGHAWVGDFTAIGVFQPQSN